MELINQPILYTSRLILRPYNETDLNDIFEYASDEETTRHLTWNAHKTIEDSKEFLHWVNETTKNIRGQLFFVFAIEDKTLHKVIGSIDFKNPNKFCGQMDYVLEKKYWNQGLMTEAAKGIKDWAFGNFPEIVRLQCYCLPENIGSRRVMEKLGMEYEGLKRKSFIIRDQAVDLVHFALVR